MKRAGRIVYWFTATTVGVFVGYLTGGFFGLFLTDPKYCVPPEPDPILGCFPGFDQNPASYFIVAGIGLFVLIVVLLMAGAALKLLRRIGFAPGDEGDTAAAEA